MSTPDQVRERFRREGKTLSQWARDNGYQPNKVYRVMAGIDKGYYGDAHDIAVKLGLKPNPSKTAA
jgi:gp16 family phage-associated protein